MNVTEYIASGILESYVMGAVSDQERREVECLSSIYPEVGRELDQLSEAIEQYAMLHSVEPPASIKDKLLLQLDFSKHEEEEADEEQESDTIVRPMPVDMSSSHPHRTTWIVAACMGLAMLLFSFFLLSQLRTNQNALASVRTRNDSLKTVAGKLKADQAQSDQVVALLSQPALKRIELKGNEQAPKGDLFIFWSADTQQVAVNVKSLPALPADKQYQLWALVDGKPVDAGVFDVGSNSSAMQALNRSVARADAFAVTVEKRGGSPAPTMSTLLAVSPVKA
jgi:anti-sigma-K factor RskA